MSVTVDNELSNLLFRIDRVTIGHANREVVRGIGCTQGNIDLEKLVFMGNRDYGRLLLGS